jgi:hypothetical protein
MPESAAAALEAHQMLVRRLLEPARYPHPTGALRLIQTHISSVLLTGGYAYKIKKPVNLGFLDFSTLEQRRFCCEEELRLNRRLAPALYLDVVPIFGTPDAPVFAGSGAAIDYAVRMREFPQEALLDGMLARGDLSASQIDAVAAMVADFHARAERAPPDSPYGGAGSVAVPVLHNFIQLRRRLRDSDDRARLAALETWTHGALRALGPVLAVRKQQGFVRQCHGDLHLANIAWVEGAVQVFDCIEFNPNLRWIDVVSEVAFLAMDLMQRGRPDMAWRFVDGWLARSGDHAAMRLFDFYLIYRALVRAKVASIRATQPGIPAQEAAAAMAAGRGYLALAERRMRPAGPALIITHGLSGSGKTTISQFLLERLGCVRLRSDVERKRLAGLAPQAASASAVGDGLYSGEMTRRTYDELARRARGVLEAGHCVIADAAFLRRWQRDRMRELARVAGVPFVIVECVASRDTLLQRIGERRAAGGDASEATPAVLEGQIATAEPLGRDESAHAVAVGSAAFEVQALADAVARALGRQTG